MVVAVAGVDRIGAAVGCGEFVHRIEITRAVGQIDNAPVESLRRPVDVAKNVVVARAPDEQVRSVSSGQYVSGAAANEGVGARASREPVALGIDAGGSVAQGHGGSDVDLDVGIQAVIASATVQDVSVRATDHQILARGAIREVAPGSGFDPVVAAAGGGDGVVAGPAGDVVVAGAVVECVLTPDFGCIWIGQYIVQCVVADLHTGCNRINVDCREVANDGVVRVARYGHGGAIQVDPKLVVLEVQDLDALACVGREDGQGLAGVCLGLQQVAVLFVRA